MAKHAIFGIIKIIKTIAGVLALLFGVYLIIFTGFYMFQDSIIFQRKSLERSYQFKFSEPFEEQFITTSDGETINALLFRSPSPSKGLILYFHGNADNIQRWGKYAIDFTSKGYDILMADYRGYGKSSGQPDEKNLYDDAQLILDWSQKNIPHSRLILYGRSLGTAVASHLAMSSPPDLLILETPFDELKGAIYSPLKPMLHLFPLHHEFPNKTFLPNIHCKIVVIHGTDDWVVPLASALALKPLLKKGDQFVIIEKGGHKNLREFDEYHKTLTENLN